MLAKNALTTVKRIKSELHLDELDTANDSKIEEAINVVSAYIETYCRRKFGADKFVERAKGSGRNNLILNNTPIISVEKVEVRGVEFTDYEILEEEGMLYCDYGWPSRRVYTGMLSAEPIGLKPDIRVEYTAGFILPKDETDTTPRTLPHDLEYACIKMVTSMYTPPTADLTEEDMGVRIVKSEKLGDWQVNYDYVKPGSLSKSSLVTPDVCVVLDYWRRFV